MTLCNLEHLVLGEKNVKSIKDFKNESLMEKIITKVKRNSPDKSHENKFYFVQENLTKKSYMIFLPNVGFEFVKEEQNKNIKRASCSNLKLSELKDENDETQINPEIYNQSLKNKKEFKLNPDLFSDDEEEIWSSLCKRLSPKYGFSKVLVRITFNDIDYNKGEKLLSNKIFLFVLHYYLNFFPFKINSHSIKFSFLNVIQKYCEKNSVFDDPIPLVICASFSLCSKFYTTAISSNLFITQPIEKGGLQEIVNKEASIMKSCFSSFFTLNPKNIMEQTLTRLIDKDNILFIEKKQILSHSLSLLFNCLIHSRINSKYQERIIIYSCIKLVICIEIQVGRSLNSIYQRLEIEEKQMNIDRTINNCILDLLNAKSIRIY